MVHFEEIWEKSEQTNKEINDQEDIQIILNELILKVNLYKAIDLKKEVAQEDHKKAKSRILGEILFTLTNISLRDDINVFNALNSALKYHSVEHYSKKYQT